MINQKTFVSVLFLTGLLMIALLTGCVAVSQQKTAVVTSGKTDFKIIEIGYIDRLEMDIRSGIQEIEANNGEVVSVSASYMKRLPGDLERIYVVIAYRTITTGH